MKLALSTVMIVMCLGLGACAGSNGFVRGGPQDQRLDYGKILAVNEWAKTRGATVLWLHYPMINADRQRTDR
ncbi:MAG TPA: hypothetical protein VFG55_00470 [Rhodanobacteraceae bacterium]|nr:hypothetical protein [Rhodanobacteraceae bacterium]